jgi:hypothetical protein
LLLSFLGIWLGSTEGRHALRNGLQNSDRRGIVKKHVKKVQAGLGAVLKAVWREK